MKIKQSCFSEMVEHCRREYPNEACGILAGKDNLITKVYKMTNTSEIPATCYFMDPREQLKAFKEMRNSRLEMLGIYHSHADSSPYPSPRDVELAFYLEASYVIVSLTDLHKLKVSAFKIGEGKIEEEEISYTEEE